MISIISGTIRDDRNSHRVALALQKGLSEREINVNLIDLKKLNFPLFTERLFKLSDPPEKLVSVSESLVKSTALILVTPEYNGGISAALKNFIDVLGEKEFANKRIGVASVSNGAMGGIRAALQLQQIILALFASPIPQMLLVEEVDKNYDENGNVLSEKSKNRCEWFLNSFLQ